MTASARGYFGIGVEGISKPGNLGNLMRSAHAFGAGFFFTIDSVINVDTRQSDTSGSVDHVPLYRFSSVGELQLPERCTLVGVEFTDEAVDLPSFPHPLSAAYVLGPERGSLSPDLVAKCEHLVKIPTHFCVNVGVAGAIVMYDRVLSTGRFGARPVNPRRRAAALPRHVQGMPQIRKPRG
ncbi:MAG: RNA methyltransferase [Alphaproteobacteria bacterium]|jgi:tRNA G18 (ribose-2'-O)-methylase SpoU|nr:RNA methyltransferase [Alphaproteobacteria bacterium]